MILFLDHDLKTLVPFLSLENNKSDIMAMLSKYIWDKIAQENYMFNVGPKHTGIFLRKK